MADEITTKMLLEHIQAMKVELLMQIAGVEQRLQRQITGLGAEMREGFEETNRKFEEARLHRQSLQEDLDATIRLQGKHSSALARLARAGSR